MPSDPICSIIICRPPCFLSGAFTMTISRASPLLRSSLSLSGTSHSEPLHPVRRASEFDINYPPRYSTLVAPSNHPIPPHDDDAIPPPGPPAYSSVFQPPRPLESADSRPSPISPCTAMSPMHTRRPVPAPHPNGIHRHQYHIIGSKAEPWATLKVYSPSSSHLDRQNTPYFTTGDLIRGVFELNLDSPQNISSISLSVSNGNVNNNTQN